MRHRERHAPWSKQSLCVITFQYSAPRRAYDFRGKITCTWQTHAMVNLIAYWQSNCYQTSHQMLRHISIRTPLFERLDPPIIAKTSHNHYVYMLSHDTFHSLFAKLMHTVILQQHRGLHPSDSHDKDLPISDALEPPLVRASTWNFYKMCPVLF